MSRAQREINDFDVNFAYDDNSDVSSEGSENENEEIPQEEGHFDLAENVWTETDQTTYSVRYS